jgi:pilus assembly protein CpaF
VRIVTFIGAKGGSGTSTLALEAAREIQKLTPAALIDGDLSGRRSIAVLLDAVRTFDGLRLEGALPIALVGGLRVVELVDKLALSFSLRAEQVEQILAELGGAETIVVDVSQAFAGALQPLMSRTTKFLVVVEPNMLGITGARALVAEHLRSVPPHRIGVVINVRDARGVEVSRREAERLLELPVLAEIPLRSDRNYLKAVSALAKQISNIVPDQELLDLIVSKTPMGERRTDARRDEMRVADRKAAELAAGDGAAGAEHSAWELLKIEIHNDLAKHVDAATVADSDKRKIAEMREHVLDFVQRLLIVQPGRISMELIKPLCDEVMDEVVGYGPLEGLLADPDISEIMVNGPKRIFVERFGRLQLTDKSFLDDRQLRLIIERIIAPIGRRVDEAVPMVDARLPDGSRVNAIIEPVSLDGATITIRRFGTKRLGIDDLVRLGAVSPAVVDLLRAAVQGRLNIVVSGGTGSGKTTFLNVLSSFIPPGERIVTIEDAAELRLIQDHVVRLESRPPNIEGSGEIKIRDLVRNALRMRPDRIIVGECRGGEALDMLQAMNTGHDGSLTSVHANSPRDALSRIETLVMMAGFDLPVRAIREQICSAVDMIIQTARLRDGSRKIMSISEVVGMEGDIVTMQEIVSFKQMSMIDDLVVGEFQYSGVQPQCMPRFAELGIPFDITQLSALPAAAGLW